MVGVSARKQRSPLLPAQSLLTIVAGLAVALVSLEPALDSQALPYRNPGQLVAVWERVVPGAPVAAISGPDMGDFANATHSVFAALGVFAVPQVWLLDSKGATRMGACAIQASAFNDLGIRPLLGRGVRPDDTSLEGNGTAPAWITYRVWHTRYGGTPSVVGTLVGIATDATGSDKMLVRIVGVLPPGVGIPLPFMENTADIWYLLPPNIGARPRESDVFFGVGRLRPGVSAAQAQAALTVVAASLAHRYRFDAGKQPVVQSLQVIAEGLRR